MLRHIVYPESDDDFGVKTFDLLRSEVLPDIECETVDSGHERLTIRDQIARPTVAVGCLTSNRFPFAVIPLPIEPHHDAGRRSSDGDIKDVGRYSAHNTLVSCFRSELLCSCDFVWFSGFSL